MLSVLKQFLSNRSQYVGVHDCHNKLFNVVSRVSHDSVLGQQLFLLYTSKLVNKLYGYTDDSTLVAVVPSPCERAAFAESVSRDLKGITPFLNKFF